MRNAHPTKAGPGRRHTEMPHPRAIAPAAGGAVAIHSNPRRNAERALCAQLGSRQYRKAAKAHRRLQRALAAHRKAQEAAS